MLLDELIHGGLQQMSFAPEVVMDEAVIHTCALRNRADCDCIRANLAEKICRRRDQQLLDVLSTPLRLCAFTTDAHFTHQKLCNRSGIRPLPRSGVAR